MIERCPTLMFIFLPSPSNSSQPSIFIHSVFLLLVPKLYTKQSQAVLSHILLSFSSFSHESLQSWSWSPSLSGTVRLPAVRSAHLSSDTSLCSPLMIVSEQFCLIVLIFRARRTLTDLLVPFISERLHLDPPMQKILREEGRENNR